MIDRKTGFSYTRNVAVSRLNRFAKRIPGFKAGCCAMVLAEAL
ncbi:MAG TPA: hypothetical protein PLJ49_05590 [Smithella sp.]|nr:hypothetical protein [Smithella sp.]HOX98657.1 hypothetical protein [Smithella sp.]HPH54929.1 hypothetical protein [Smithella sp.]HPL46556.1 hypothetical protein [Smithella sp.]